MRYLGIFRGEAGKRGPNGCFVRKVEHRLKRGKRQTRAPEGARLAGRSVTREDKATHRDNLARYLQPVARGGSVLNRVATSQVSGKSSGGPTKERIHDSQVEGAGTSKGVKTGRE